MASGTPSFVQRMLASKILGELIEYLPEPARDALVDVRDHVQKHGHFPKFEPIRTTPLGPSESAQALGVYVGTLDGEASLRMVNVLKGEVRGGSLRGVNAILGDVHAGEIRGTNFLIGAVRGGDLRGVNVLLGPVYGGQLRAINVLIGDIHGGDVRCQVLLGNVLGGTVSAKLMKGEILGGTAEVERMVE